MEDGWRKLKHNMKIIIQLLADITHLLIGYSFALDHARVQNVWPELPLPRLLAFERRQAYRYRIQFVLWK